jgi:SAM-dependent methyltransferase
MKHEQYVLMHDVEDVHWWYRVLRGLVLNALNVMVPRGKRVLDAGCGTGGMLRSLGEWETYGCDVSEEAVELCRSHHLSRITSCDLQAMPYPVGMFDAVLSLDVLYHSRVEERVALREMRRVLKPGGLLVVNVPAFECLSGMHDRAVDGARRYRKEALCELLHGQGFEVVEVYYWNAWLFLPLLLRRKISQDEHGDLGMPPRWLNVFLSAVGKLDARLCRRMRLPLGTSLFAIARRCSEPVVSSCGVQIHKPVALISTFVLIMSVGLS